MKEIFDILGFKKEEVKTYYALLENGPLSASEVSKITGFKRPTTYTYLETLINGGMATRSLRRGVKIYVPQPLSHTDKLLDRKIADIQQKRQKLTQSISNIETQIGINPFHPRIQFFEGREEVENAHLDMLNYTDITARIFWSNDSAIHSISEDFFWYYNQERIKRNISAKGIWSHDQNVDTQRYPFMSVGKELLREVRRAPETLNFLMNCRIYANKVIYFSSRVESFCFILESEEFAQSIAAQHKTIWQISTPIQETEKRQKTRFFKE